MEGVLCRKRDAAGFAKGLKYLAEMDPDKREEFVTYARAFVERAFSERRLLDDIEYLNLGIVRNGSVKEPGSNQESVMRENRKNLFNDRVQGESG